MESQCIANGIKNSLKRKQRLYQKFLKKRIEKTSLGIKTIENYLNQLRNVKKKLHFSRLILKYQNNIKRTWNIIKDAIGKTKSAKSIFSKIHI